MRILCNFVPLSFSGAHKHLSDNAMQLAKDAKLSPSNQTCANNKILPPTTSAISAPQPSSHSPSVGSNYTSLWPKKSATADTFFRYNAKTSFHDERILNQHIPEKIIPEITKEEKVRNGNSDPLSLYLVKEKEENKIRPKVST